MIKKRNQSPVFFGLEIQEKAVLVMAGDYEREKPTVLYHWLTGFGVQTIMYDVQFVLIWLNFLMQICMIVSVSSFTHLVVYIVLSCTKS